MTTAVGTERFLAAMMQRGGGEQGRGRPGPVVTISRQAGIDAIAYAEALIQAMAAHRDQVLFSDWQVIDRKLCEQVAADKELSASVRSLIAEDYHPQIDEFVLGLLGWHTPQDTAMMDLVKLIRSIASLGKVIIIGRGGSQVVRGMSHGINIRLIGSEPFRTRQLAASEHKQDVEARQVVREHDRERARLLKTHFQADIDNPLLYDMIVNAERVSPAVLGAAVVGLLEQHYGKPGT